MTDETKNAKANPESPDQVADEQLDDASGGGTGRRTYEPIVVRKRVDIASPIVDADQDPPGDFKQGS